MGSAHLNPELPPAVTPEIAGRSRRHAPALGLLLLLGACADAGPGGPVLRVSGIPDADKARLERQFSPVADYLSARLGQLVRYEHMTDYTAAVVALGSGTIDLAWLGGVTAVDAESLTRGGVTFVACRQLDLRFKSYFIANAEAVASGRVARVSALSELRPHLSGLRFTFGSKKSTSGHIMPRYFLARAGIDPETDFAGPPGYQLVGGHDATLRAVAAGQFDVGALNFASWERAPAELQARAPIVYVSPEYVDYCLLAHNRLGAATIETVRKALTDLDPADPQHRTVLDAFSAERFVAARAADWDGIRQVLRDPAVREILK